MDLLVGPDVNQLALEFFRHIDRTIFLGQFNLYLCFIFASGCVRWPPPVGRTVRDCGDAVRVGWLVLRALVHRG
ncbi:MAG: hypothetical protein PHW87_07760 [Methanothrix sp.]|nr:hypothetical protein [Methanothrix sp.]